MSFSADWLSLRRDADRRARNPRLAGMLGAHLTGPARVLDLGAGTGANLAATSPVLRGPQHWVLADSDADLLARVVPPEGVEVTRRVIDLAGDLAGLLQPRPDLVTASAFFDLCGADIIRRVVEATVGAGAAFYTVLTYDGREAWAPAHPLDARALAAFHADQRRDKGLGPALGPDATAALAEGFAAAGYRVETGPSDWTLTAARDAALIAALAEGSAVAISPPLSPAEADAWRTARQRATNVMIGHLDLLALPR